MNPQTLNLAHKRRNQYSHKYKLSLFFAIMAFALGLASGTQAGWIYTKAVLAQLLLDNAWRDSLANNTAHKPWSWADIRTIARLDIVDTESSYIVLSDASGEAMAFGPGLVAGKPTNAANSTVAIGGHRDTHLSFLEHLPIGAHINLQNTQGQLLRYELFEKTVVNSNTQSIKIAQNDPGLVLITCYPFNAAQTGGPLRLVAKAKLISG